MSSSNGKFVVGVIGTQNTGKSTFIKDVVERLLDTDSKLQSVGCDYRKKIADAGLQINRNGNLRCQQIICDTLIEQMDIIKGMPSGNYVTDRSPIDAYAYTVYLFRHKPELGIKQEDLDEMFSKVQESVKDYDTIIYIDLDKCENVKVVDDKFRDTNLEYRKEIDEIFKETLARLDLDSVVDSTISGSREERVSEFLSKYTSSLIHSA